MFRITKEDVCEKKIFPMFPKKMLKASKVEDFWTWENIEQKNSSKLIKKSLQNRSINKYFIEKFSFFPLCRGLYHPVTPVFVGGFIPHRRFSPQAPTILWYKLNPTGSRVLPVNVSISGQIYTFSTQSFSAPIFITKISQTSFFTVFKHFLTFL